MVVKSFLIVAMASFYFTIVARSSGTDAFVLNTNLTTHDIEWVGAIRFLLVSKLSAIVRLKYLRFVTKVKNGPF